MMDEIGKLKEALAKAGEELDEAKAQKIKLQLEVKRMRDQVIRVERECQYTNFQWQEAQRQI